MQLFELDCVDLYLCAEDPKNGVQDFDFQR